ncbi:MAG TPA: hypothetical protein VK915_04145 [Gaiellaceae bacterium]|nr:hypothetical protein [Gaiellaceae bacterium]
MALDWPGIAGLYGELVRMTGSVVVELNRAIAVADVDGAEAGLALVDRLDLDGCQYFHSTEPTLLRRVGRADEAGTEYERALSSPAPSRSVASCSGASQNPAHSGRRLPGTAATRPDRDV